MCLYAPARFAIGALLEAAVLIGARNIFTKISDVSFRGKTNFERTAATRRTRDGHVRGGLAAGQAAPSDTCGARQGENEFIYCTVY